MANSINKRIWKLLTKGGDISVTDTRNSSENQVTAYVVMQDSTVFAISDDGAQLQGMTMNDVDHLILTGAEQTFYGAGISIDDGVAYHNKIVKEEYGSDPSRFIIGYYDYLEDLPQQTA